MSTSFENFQKRRLISSYFSVVLSIALVLFLLGVLGLFLLNAQKVSNHFKEQVTLTIYLKDTAKDVEIKQLEKSLVLSEHVKSTEYVSKEQAAELMQAENGEDFMSFLGYNPLQNSLDVNLKASYVTTQQLDSISAVVSEKQFVDDVRYDSDLVSIMNNNVKKITFWILILSGLFTLIAVLLINSSIRLSVHSKRFIIKTMQLVGATKQFIRKPFIIKSLQLGLLGALIAVVGVAVVLYYLNTTFPELELLNNPILIAILFISIIGIGLLIAWLSTFFATQRFLNLKTDRLYS